MTVEQCFEIATSVCEVSSHMRFRFFLDEFDEAVVELCYGAVGHEVVDMTVCIDEAHALHQNIQSDHYSSDAFLEEPASVFFTCNSVVQR